MAASQLSQYTRRDQQWRNQNVNFLPTLGGSMAEIDVRKGMPPRKLDRTAFERRYLARYQDPIFDPLQTELQAVVDAAWDAYAHGRKSPRTRKAGTGFADPDYSLAIDWIEAHEAIEAAQARQHDRTQPARILLVNGSSRTEHTCPGEMSKSWRLVEIARKVTEEQPGFAVDVLDLSRTTSEFGRAIHPCKSCVSTSMALCHWPCSCYPNYSLGQVDDWMNEIYPLWVAADGIMVVTPVNWYQAPGPLKAMIDRLVCADGGNPDPTSTHGKNAEEAKALEMAGWPYPRHLAGRFFSAIIHGDTVGAETLRRILMDWAASMHLRSAGSVAEVDGYIGYYQPYASSHAALDKDVAFQMEVRNAAIGLCEAVAAHRCGTLTDAGHGLKDPRPK
jgi:multimeric flavodoxin WrbA